MNLKPLAGIAVVALAAAMVVPAADATLVPRTVMCDEFGYFS